MQMYTSYVFHIENLMGNASFLIRLIRVERLTIILALFPELWYYAISKRAINLSISVHLLCLLIVDPIWPAPLSFDEVSSELYLQLSNFYTLFMHYLQNQIVMSQEYRSIKIVIEISRAHPICSYELTLSLFVLQFIFHKGH